MSQVATTKMSSRGQVVIPESIRELLSIHTGTQFIVIGQGDTIVLKSISPPPVSKFKGLLAKAEKAAKESGLKKTDVDTAIAQSRKAQKRKK